jgi:hypothetical protein
MDAHGHIGNTNGGKEWEDKEAHIALRQPQGAKNDKNPYKE